ncbi:MAG: Ku protein [Actinomycetota bacterium]|nr:Ku protein [Actinomycetota bacterium]
MPRSIWTGSISFGLVTLPVKAYTAVRDHDVHFHQLDRKSGARIRNRKVSEKTGREVEQDDIDLGYEIRKGRYVKFTPDELDDLRPESSRIVEITDFVALEDVDPIYYDRTYWLGPSNDEAKKAYGLLLAAMEERQRVAIGTVVMRNKQHLAAIRPLDGALAMSTMRFEDEVVGRSEIDGVPNRRTKPAPKELALATQIIDALAADWRPGQYRDTYTDELKERILAKDRGDEVVEEDEVESEKSADVVDLMAALERSVKEAKSGRRRSAPKAKSSSARKPAKKATKKSGSSSSKRKSA